MSQEQRSPADAGPATNATTRLPETVTPIGVTAEHPIRRPCRTRGCSGTRPLVDVGSSHLWDRCYRCTRRGLNGRPAYAGTAVTAVPDPWHERVAELLDAAELAGAGWSA